MIRKLWLSFKENKVLEPSYRLIGSRKAPWVVGRTADKCSCTLPEVLPPLNADMVGKEFSLLPLGLS